MVRAVAIPRDEKALLYEHSRSEPGSLTLRRGALTAALQVLAAEDMITVGEE